MTAADILTLDHIDFNYPCAFSLFCTCPIPSKRNHLPFVVTAGEKTPGISVLIRAKHCHNTIRPSIPQY
ncbi:DUF1684 domain-containing protein [Bifidobacterium breve]|uniref:DUF1684 domain-containing protein n=1 Tax=Bifidobacterium breve TaxID=1685 RepID=UPI002433EC3F|nr:DUF1684 domain-containing protein [Bifidobacterium breve]MDG5961832.1 DUF1684 domain-containing protein [Bifidobacterium breve]